MLLYKASMTAKEQAEKLKKAFVEFDTDGSGALTHDEARERHFALCVDMNPLYAAWESMEQMREFRAKFETPAIWAMSHHHYADFKKRGKIPTDPDELSKLLEENGRAGSWLLA